MTKKTIIYPVVGLFVVLLIVIFYNEGILFNNDSNEHYLDSLMQTSDTIKGTEVPLGSPPGIDPGMYKDTVKSGSSNTGTKHDGSVPTKNKSEKDTVKKIVPLGDPPAEETSTNSGSRGHSGDPVQEDRSK